nr:MAG TPA: hypothetical protein [Caudoviricetes sp.]
MSERIKGGIPPPPVVASYFTQSLYIFSRAKLKGVD